MSTYFFLFAVPTVIACGGAMMTLAGFRAGQDMVVAFRQPYTARATGTVLKTQVEVDGPSGASRRFPIVRFTAGPGRTVEFRSTVHSNRRRFDPGARVPVAYDPVHPDRARIDAYMRGTPLTVTIIGTRIAVLSLIWLFLSLLVVALGPGHSGA